MFMLPPRLTLTFTPIPEPHLFRSNVGGALSALDGAISGLDSRVTELESFPGNGNGNGNNGCGNNGSGGRYTGGSTSETAVAGTGGRTSVGDGDAAHGCHEGQAANVAAGVAAPDAGTKGQRDTGNTPN